jgi:RNA polymerase sigma-70 factor, ECF subfamily
MTEFEDWYRRERPMVLSACLALAGNLDAAREATDEAFTRACERWETVGAMGAPGAWTQTVALNYLRRRLRRRPLLRVFRVGQHDVPAPEVPDLELWQSVRRLPARQQTAVVLRYVHDLSYEQIAEAMNISMGAVASTLNAAHRNLARPASSAEPNEEKVDG